MAAARSLAVCVACAGLLLGTLDARAESKSAAPKPAAEALFEEAVALSDKGQWPEACKKLEASQSLDAAVGTLLRLADCYERTGRWAAAWAHFREARSMAQSQGMTERERIAKLRAEALEPKIARVTISVPAQQPQGFQVMLGDTVVPSASFGTALPVDPGTTTVVAGAPGYVPYRTQFKVPDASGARLSVVIPDLDAEPQGHVVRLPATPAYAKRPAKGRPVSTDTGYAARALGVTFAAVGGVGLATGGVLALLSSKRNEESLDECPTSPRLCTPSGVQLREDAATLADMATVSTAVGGGLLATGVVVYFVGSQKREKQEPTVAVAPSVSLRSLSLQARGRF